MNLFLISTIFLLLFSSIIHAYPDDAKVYFQSLVPNSGYVYGLAKVVWEFDGKLTIDLEKFETLSKDKLVFNLVVEKFNPHQIMYGSCIQSKCTINLSNFPRDNSNGEITMFAKKESGMIFKALGNRHILFDFPFSNGNFKDYKSCVVSPDFNGYRQCVCEFSASQLETKCKRILPTPCYTIKPTVELDELKYAVPAIKIKFETTFVEPADEQKIYVYDESQHQFYTLTYDKVPNTEESIPINRARYFQMKLRIGIVEKSEIDGVHKSTYIIMNFDLKEMISFQNAFCSKNGNIVECACCEHTEIDQMCHSREGGKFEVDSYASLFLKGYGYMYMKGKSWVDKNKRFHVHFKDGITKYFEEDLVYNLASLKASDLIVEVQECHFEQIADPCSLDLTKDGISYVRLQACPTSDKCFTLIKITIKNQDIGLDLNTAGCAITQKNSDNWNQCHCSRGASPDSSSGCIVLPVNCQIPGSSSAVHSFTIDLNSYQFVILPLLRDKYLLVYDAQKNYDLIVKMSPPNPQFPTTHPQVLIDLSANEGGTWVASVYIGPTGETHISNEGNKRNTITYTDLEQGSNQITYLTAFCKLSGDEKTVTCDCCDGEPPNVKCKTSPEYTFHFSKNFDVFGYAFGSGRIWKSKTEIYASVQNVYPEASPVRPVILKSANQASSFFNIGELVSITYDNTVTEVEIQLKVLGVNAAAEKVVKFEIDANGLIKHQDNSVCELYSDTTDTSYKACLCPVGVEPTESSCPLTKQNPCTSAIASPNKNPKHERPAFSFSITSHEFTKPTLSKGPYDKIVREALKYKLTYGAVRGLSTNYPADDPVFLMRISMGEIQQQSVPSTIMEMNFDPRGQFYMFSPAYCKTSSPIGTNSISVECVCCEGYTGESDTMCMVATIKSEINLKFSVLIKDYGYMFVQGKFLLDSRQVFTFKGTELTKAFDNRFQFNFVRIVGTSNDIQICVEWPECTLKFNNALQNNDIIKMEVVLLGSNKQKIPETKMEVESFTIENGEKIKSKGANCVSNSMTTGSQSCVCPNDKDFDSNCGQIDPLVCQKITQNDFMINGKPHNKPAFSIKISSDPGENNNVYALNENDKLYYTFSYKNQKDPSNPNANLGYEVSIGPTRSSTSLTKTTNTIKMNFNSQSGLIFFKDGIKCDVNSGKTEWFCECCSPNECEDEILTTTTLRASTTTRVVTAEPYVPEEVDPCLKPNANITVGLCKILEKGKVDSTNMDEYIKETVNVIQVKTATAADIQVAGKIFAEIANVKDATVEQRKDAIGLLDHVLAVDDKEFKSSSRETNNNYISSIHKILTESQSDLSYLTGDNVGVQKTLLDCSGGEKWSGIMDEDNKFKIGTGNSIVGGTGAAIELSHDRLCENKAKDSKNSVYFVIYRNGKLFNEEEGGDGVEEGSNKEGNKMTKNGFFQRFVSADENNGSSEESGKVNRCKKNYLPTNGFILTSVVWNSENATNQINARLRFKKDEYKMPEHSNLAVTWWDKSSWSSEKQCKFKLEGDEYVAYCDHLTNFALLVETSSTDPLLCDFLLDRLGFWLSIISLVALFILLFIYSTRLIPVVKDSIFIKILNNNRRAGSDNLIILYVFVMLWFYFFFLIFADQSLTNSHIVCKLTAAFLYDLFLSAMLLNIFQAWQMIKICAWTSTIEAVLEILTKIWIVLPVSLGLPFLITLIIWFTDTNFFFRNDQFCWIRPRSVIYAVLIPVTLMLVNSFVTFMIFCTRMFPELFNKIGIKRASIRMASAEKKQRMMNFELFIAILFAQFILGFPWILQYPAMFSSGSTAWHYLFALFNGTNGIILFSMYFYGRVQAFYRIRSSANSNSSSAVPTQQTAMSEGTEN